jgi:hypothetical protein
MIDMPLSNKGVTGTAGASKGTKIIESVMGRRSSGQRQIGMIDCNIKLK